MVEMIKLKLPTWFVLLLPAILILAAVVLIPLLLSLYSSFTPYRLTRPETLFKWIGTFNYEKAVKSCVFWLAFGRTVLLLTIALNLEMFINLNSDDLLLSIHHYFSSDDGRKIVMIWI